jgi:hypothetical protein
VASLPATVVTNNETGVTLSGTFSGNGGGLTNLNAAQLVSGTNPIVLYADTNNNFYGAGAGNLTTSGGDNIAIGVNALLKNTNGSANTAIGVQALEGNMTGNQNTAVGTRALFDNSTGSNNTGVGYSALFYNGSGSYNTAYGVQALFKLGIETGIGGSNNIALGYGAATNYLYNESGNIIIGNAGVANENNIIRIGTPGVQATTYIAGVINGNGGGLTNLNVNLANVSGVLPASTTYTVAGNQSGGWGSPVLLVTNINSSATASPALRAVGYGNSPNGVLSVSSQGTGLIAQFGNAAAFVADITTNGTVDATGFNGGSLRVGGSGTTITNMEAGQAIMPASSLQETNYTITFPTAFSSSPKIIFSLANDPGFQGVSDIFSANVSSNSPAAFSINVYRLNGTSWSQQLRINWQAWQ